MEFGALTEISQAHYKGKGVGDCFARAQCSAVKLIRGVHEKLSPCVWNKNPCWFARQKIWMAHRGARGRPTRLMLKIFAPFAITQRPGLLFRCALPATCVIPSVCSSIRIRTAEAGAPPLS